LSRINLQGCKLHPIFNIIGYDCIKNNESKIADISMLDEESDLIDISIYCQLLIDLNWKKCLTEGKRVLRNNGEMIISESVERFNSIKEYLVKDLEMIIINVEYNESTQLLLINMK
jgi:hypothetical protein